MYIYENISLNSSHSVKYFRQSCRENQNTYFMFNNITVKYADDLALMSKKETVLQSMMDKLIEVGRCYGMEMNVEKTKVM